MRHSSAPRSSLPAPRFDEDRAWRAVQARDGSADGRFVYAVRSTGIYCRPSCPSRRPARARVAFYARPDEAEAAGFRACRRCDPRGHGPARQTARDAVRRARALLDARAGERVTLGELARAVGLSPSHLQRIFTRATGLSPRAYQEAQRMERLRKRLRQGDTVSRATFDAGFGSGSRVYERAGATLGMTPGALRRGGAAVVVRYATVGTSLGRLLVAATERGVCAVMLGDDDEALDGALRADLPRATLVPDGGTMAEWVRAVVQRVEGSSSAGEIPLDLDGTTFQRQVWRELQRIPAGETRSYAALAAALGRPTAARAVARACASNPVAVVVPCHRVVGSDGSLTGYRWGVERKRELLRRERTR